MKFSVIIPVKDEAELLSYSLPSIFALEPDEVILVMEPNGKSVDRAREIALASHYIEKTKIIVLFESCDWRLRHAYARRKGFQLAGNDLILTVDVDKIVDPKILEYFHLVGKNNVRLVSFSEIPYHFSYRWFIYTLLQKLGYPHSFMGLYVFSKKAWLETEDTQSVKQIYTSDDTHLVECLKRKYRTLHISDVKNINIRPKESKEYEFLIGIERRRYGTSPFKILISSFLLLRPLTILGYLKARKLTLKKRFFGKWAIKSIETEFTDEIVGSLPKTAKVLDVGCGNSFWPRKWISRGYQIMPMDIVKCKHQEVPYVRADIRKPPFKDESIDMINCLCTIEHIGVAGCPPPKGPYEDLKAMDEMKRILKDDGVLVLTTQIGNEYYNEEYPQRNYSRERLNLLLKGWKVVKEETYGNFGEGWNKSTWKPATWEEILEIPETVGKGIEEWYGDICLVLKKED